MEHTKYAYSRLLVLIKYTEYGYNRLSFDRVRLESVQLFGFYYITTVNLYFKIFLLLVSLFDPDLLPFYFLTKPTYCLCFFYLPLISQIYMS
jgi:hypothetical protein